jgi:hypothetical protein
MPSRLARSRSSKPPQLTTGQPTGARAEPIAPLTRLAPMRRPEHVASSL